MAMKIEDLLKQINELQNEPLNTDQSSESRIGNQGSADFSLFMLGGVLVIAPKVFLPMVTLLCLNTASLVDLLSDI